MNDCFQVRWIGDECKDTWEPEAIHHAWILRMEDSCQKDSFQKRKQVMALQVSQSTKEIITRVHIKREGNWMSLKVVKSMCWCIVVKINYV